MPQRQQTPITAVPLRGGMNTVLEPPQLSPGQFSMVQNLRPRHPGFEKRPGQRKQHSTADGANQVQTLYQFRKNKIDEDHFFAQMSDGDILEASNNPPSTTTGVFGTEIFSGSTGQSPASWAALQDLLVMSNAVDQHQIYAGQDNYIQMFVVYDHTEAADPIPQEGFDYTDEVTDGLTTTVAVLDSIGTDSDQCVFICCPVRANRLTLTVSAANGNSVTMTVSYFKNDNTWASASATDETASGGATLAQTGSVYWTPPSDEIPWFMFGQSGFWYRLTFSGALDAEVELSKVTYGTDHDGSGTRTSFLDIVNVWDGVIGDAIEAQVYDNSAGTYAVHGTTAIDLGTIVFDENDALFIGSVEPLQGIYCDIGETPNTGDATAVDAVYYWDHDGWQSVSSLDDQTGGLKSPGWITWKRPSDEYPQQFRSTQYYAYWYKVEVNDALSDDVILAIYTMPYFDIDELGNGVACCSWSNRMCYSFDKWGNYIYVSKRNEPLVLNGTDYAVLEAGDGRSNKVIAMTRFHTEMIAWQEEKGIEGGCTTLFEGYSPATFGKMLLSPRVGILNSKCYVVVDGVLTSTATEEKVKTLVFWLSRYGACVSDGLSVSIFSDAVQNYFDPTKSECIRRGYEDQHYIGYDSAFNVLRIGLVSGSSATTPNIELVFDLTDKVWYKDSLAQHLSCVTEVEASSGNVPVIQVGGGTADGTVYQLNYGTEDVTTAITAYLDIEFGVGGEFLRIDELLLRCKSQSAGDISLTIYANGISDVTETLSMIAENTSEIVRRHVLSLNVQDQHITIRLQHSTESQEMYLYDLGMRLYKWLLR